MQRQFKLQVLAAGGTPQPLISTTTSAAVGPVGTNVTSLQSIPVVDSSPFINSDWIILDPAGTNPERLLIEAVPDATHIKVQGMEFVHGSGVFVQLAIGCAILTVQAKPANSGIIYIGDNGMNKSTGPYLYILELTAAGLQPNTYVVNPGSGENVVVADDFWFDGTTSDAILPSLTTK